MARHVSSPRQQPQTPRQQPQTPHQQPQTPRQQSQMPHQRPLMLCGMGGRRSASRGNAPPQRVMHWSPPLADCHVMPAVIARQAPAQQGQHVKVNGGGGSGTEKSKKSKKSKKSGIEPMVVLPPAPLSDPSEMRGTGEKDGKGANGSNEAPRAQPVELRGVGVAVTGQ